MFSYPGLGRLLISAVYAGDYGLVLGVAAISIIGLLIAVFIGVGLVWKEVERRSIYSVLSAPRPASPAPIMRRW